MNNGALKTIGVTGAVIVVIAHIGALGHLIRTNEEIASKPRVPQLPQINIPSGEYSSYEVEVGPNGYRIKYRANDPKVMTSERSKSADTTKKGFFGGGTSKTSEWRRDEYTAGGYRNTQGGSVAEEGKLSADQVACIKAVGGAQSQGAMAGTALASGFLAPALTGIPYVGWLAAGWANLLGQRVGEGIGTEIGTVFNDC